MTGGRVRWTTMTTKGVMSWRKLLSVSPRQRARCLLQKLKGACTTFLWNNLFFFVLLSVCNDKEGVILYAPINLCFHSRQLNELNWGGPDIFTAESETINECEQGVENQILLRS